MTSKQNHLAIFLPGLQAGGAERNMLKLARGFIQRGYRVDLVLVRAEGPLLGEVPGGVRVIDLQARRIILCLPNLLRYLRTERPDTILSCLVTNIIAIWAKCISRIKVRVIVSERTTISEEALHYASDLRMRLLPALIKNTYPKADGIVVVSEAVANDLHRWVKIPRELMSVIYNPIITPEFIQMTNFPIDHPWFTKGQPPVILSVGRLVAQKDFSTLIKAFGLVRKEQNTRLMILGEGEARPELEALIMRLEFTDDISLPGYIANPYPFMRRSSMFVLSSLWEGLPGVLIEALFCGIPSIATDCPGGSREILGAGKYGKLVPVGDAVALAAAIKDQLDDSQYHSSLFDPTPYELQHILDQYARILFPD